VLHFQQSHQDHQLHTKVNQKLTKVIKSLESGDDSAHVPAALQHEVKQTINQLVNQQAAEVHKGKQIKAEIEVSS